MIKDSPIVEDIRRIRNKISEKFDHDIDRYITYLQSRASSRQREATVLCSDSSDKRIADTENHEHTGKENQNELSPRTHKKTQ